jgi:hypothetical protein
MFSARVLHTFHCSARLGVAVATAVSLASRKPPCYVTTLRILNFVRYQSLSVDGTLVC